MSNLTTKADSEENKDKNCTRCDKHFIVPKYGMKSYEHHCPECVAHEGEEQRKAIRDAREANWKRSCPKHFQQTDIAKLPAQEQVRLALDWQFGPIGLLLYGPTGAGKTRTAWLVLRNMYLRGRSYEVLNSLAGLEYASKFSDSAAVVERWVNDMIETDVLFMDDIFKNKFTDSFEGIIFSIVDRRTENGRPIILTANDTGSSLTNRMTDDRGEPLVRRLREFCLSLNFEP